MRRVQQLAAWLLFTLGGIHCLMTFRIHPNLEGNAVWFLGTGLMMVFLGLLNLLGSADLIARGLRTVLAADALGVAFGVVAVRAVPEPQVLFGAALLTTLFVTAAFAARRRPPSRP